jgi:hypothetical protein
MKTTPAKELFPHTIPLIDVTTVKTLLRSIGWINIID